MATATELQDFLFETLKGIRDGSVNTDKAKAITSVANVMVSSAKVEVDFANAVGNVDSKFLQRLALTQPQLPSSPPEQPKPDSSQLIEQSKSTTANGGQIERDGAVTRHKLK